MKVELTTDNPYAYEIGIITAEQSDDVMRNDSAIDLAFVDKFVFVNMTSLCPPVLPDVGNNSAKFSIQR